MKQDTNQVLDNPHFDNMRKFNLYTMMDQVERVRPLIAIPVIDNTGLQTVQSRYEESLTKLLELIGLKRGYPVTPEEEAFMKQVLRDIHGPDLKTAQDWLGLEDKPEDELIDLG